VAARAASASIDDEPPLLEEGGLEEEVLKLGPLLIQSSEALGPP
jgi:hypothetical protein